MVYKHKLCDRAIVLEVYFLACRNCRDVAFGIKKSEEVINE